MCGTEENGQGDSTHPPIHLFPLTDATHPERCFIAVLEVEVTAGVLFHVHDHVAGAAELETGDSGVR